MISQPFGTISFQGPGVFLAGGAGITPFIAILREQQARKKNMSRNTLIFANKTPADIICEKEFREYFGERCILNCSEQSAPGYLHRRVDKAFLQESIKNFDQQFYICGPPGFMKVVKSALQEFGVDSQSVIFAK